MNDEQVGRRWLAANLGCDPASLDKLAMFAAELRDENRRQNLVSDATLAELWWRHVVDSAQLLLVSRGTRLDDGPWLDLGTGAGFPGLVAGVLEGRRDFLLVEQRRRRADFLQRVVDRLRISNVRVVRSTLEQMAPAAAAVISARAFAPLPKLLHLAARFSTRQTLWLLPKGEKARQEVDGLARDLRPMFHVEPSATNPAAGIVVGRGAIDPQRGVRAC